MIQRTRSRAGPQLGVFYLPALAAMLPWGAIPGSVFRSTLAVVRFLLAPSVLRRMANRQSGSVVAAARERVLSRGY